MIQNQSCLESTLEDWRKALDNNPLTEAGFIDISKAFDCIPHDLSITKLHGYGLGFNTVTFLFTYFKGRKQKVSINISSLF